MFRECRSLTNVTIPSSVTSIGYSAFKDCISLTGITIPESVTNIDRAAFEHCSSLTSLTIPESVTRIGDGAFKNCEALSSVYFKGNAPVVDYPFNSGTVYYLPRTTGWEAWLDGRPTVLWDPQVQTGDDSFGARINGFGFNIVGATNLVIVVEACTNLSDPLWSPVGTNTLLGGSSYFNDSARNNHPIRFYRLRSP